MKICRLVIELIEREGRNHSEVARELTRRGSRSRTGKVKWDSKTISNILVRDSYGKDNCDSNYKKGIECPGDGHVWVDQELILPFIDQITWFSDKK
jgi:hypothetical protein